MNINSVAIGGNLGRDPELKVTQSGTQVCKFSMCVHDRRKNQQGEWEDEPNWVDVTFFGKRAESIHRYLSKGSLVFVKGRLHQSRWENKDGQKRSKLEVIGDDIQFADSDKRQQQPEQQGYQPPQGYQYTSPQQGYQQPMQQYQQPAQGYQGPSQQQMDYGGTPDVYDEDIPF